MTHDAAIVYMADGHYLRHGRNVLACLMLGYAIEKVKFKPITQGGTVGTLLMAVIISSVVGTQSTYDLLAEHSKREGVRMNQCCVYLLSRNDAMLVK